MESYAGAGTRARATDTDPTGRGARCLPSKCDELGRTEGPSAARYRSFPSSTNARKTVSVRSAEIPRDAPHSRARVRTRASCAGFVTRPSNCERHRIAIPAVLIRSASKRTIARSINSRSCRMAASDDPAPGRSTI